MRSRVLLVVLLILGLGRMAADAVQIAPLVGVFAATGAAPAPKVFGSVRGLETFSSRFVLHWRDERGHARRLAIGAEEYARLSGPYNRRNVYGAALAYGPVLAANEHGRPMLENLLRYADVDARLLRELGVRGGVQAGSMRIELQPRAGSAPAADLPLVLEVPR